MSEWDYETVGALLTSFPQHRAS